MRHPKKSPNVPRPAVPFPEINRYRAWEPEPGKVFTQTSAGVEGPISPHELFGLFTYEIILEKKVFVR